MVTRCGTYLGSHTLDGDVDFLVLVDTVVGRCHDPFGFSNALFNMKLIKQVTFLSHDFRKIRFQSDSCIDTKYLVSGRL